MPPKHTQGIWRIALGAALFVSRWVGGCVAGQVQAQVARKPHAYRAQTGFPHMPHVVYGLYHQTAQGTSSCLTLGPTPSLWPPYSNPGTRGGVSVKQSTRLSRWERAAKPAARGQRQRQPLGWCSCQDGGVVPRSGNWVLRDGMGLERRANWLHHISSTHQCFATGGGGIGSFPHTCMLSEPRGSPTEPGNVGKGFFWCVESIAELFCRHMATTSALDLTNFQKIKGELASLVHGFLSHLHGFGLRSLRSLGEDGCPAHTFGWQSTKTEPPTSDWRLDTQKV